VLERVGLAYVTLWKWMQQGKFPRSREVGGKIAWLESDIDVWIEDLPVKRLKGDAP
jgi:prophage regulatory protein